ncbi:hypothetical protein MRX96_026475 [Rhipicephalus microplus]
MHQPRNKSRPFKSGPAQRFCMTILRRSTYHNVRFIVLGDTQRYIDVMVGGGSEMSRSNVTAESPDFRPYAVGRTQQGFP